MYCKISNENVAKVLRMLKEVPYKYSADVIHVLEYSLQPLEDTYGKTEKQPVEEEQKMRQG